MRIPMAFLLLSSLVVGHVSQGVSQTRAASWEELRGMIPQHTSLKLATEQDAQETAAIHVGLGKYPIQFHQEIPGLFSRNKGETMAVTTFC